MYLSRGPKGIWTLQKRGKDIPEMKTSFVFAVPSLTHQVLSFEQIEQYLI